MFNLDTSSFLGFLASLIALIIIFDFWLVVLGIMLYYILEWYDRFKETRQSKKFIQKIEEYRHDFE